ncbi:MAG: hypothetical protein ACRBCJ_14735 [Hyphomicrobiaceae bacterium]
METFILYGVETKSLEQARVYVETTLNISLLPREGYFMGGDYYHYDFTSYGKHSSLRLKHNRDFDDIENEVGGMSDPEYPDYSLLIHLDFTEEIPHAVAALDAAPEYFKKLRTETD